MLSTKKFASTVCKTLAATAVIFVTAAAAQAATVTGNMAVILSGFDGNLPTIGTAPTDIATFNGNQSPTDTNNAVFGKIKKTSSTKYTSAISLSFPTPGVTTYNLLQIDPAGTCGNDCAKNMEGTGPKKSTYLTDIGTITVDFSGTFTDNGKTYTGTFSESGIFSAKYGGQTLSCASGDGHSKTDTDCIEWEVSTIDDTFNSAVSITLVDAVDWDLVPQIELGINSDALGAPLPATLPLFAGGLGMIGLFGAGKRRKARAA